MSEARSDSEVLGKPLKLPCGVILKNRMIKSAMSDSLGNGQGDSTPAQARLYERWALGGIAVAMIGEVQGDVRFPEKPGNLVLGTQSDRPALQSLVSRGTTGNSHLWVQLGHAGALAHAPICTQPQGPSPLNVEGLQCAGMSIADIEELPAMYARTAAMAKQVGFTGVHLHAGHGFLLSHFLSPLFNHRTDSYGGSVEARCRIVVHSIDAIRKAVGPDFPVGIRINATDQLEGGLTEEDALEVVRILDKTSIDLIDISGGTYFPGAKASSDGSGRGGPYFVEFARRAKGVTNVPIMATGGFKRREQAVDAVASGAVDMVGLARAMVLNPSLANAWLTDKGGDPVFPKFESTPPGGVTAWYTMRLTALGEDREDTFSLDLPSALRIYNERDDQRCVKWRERCSQSKTL